MEDVRDIVFENFIFFLMIERRRVRCFKKKWILNIL